MVNRFSTMIVIMFEMRLDFFENMTIFELHYMRRNIIQIDLAIYKTENAILSQIESKK